MPEGGGLYYEGQKSVGEMFRERAKERRTTEAKQKETRLKTNRSVKEYHRKKMIDFMMDKRREKAGIYHKKIQHKSDPMSSSNLRKQATGDYYTKNPPSAKKKWGFLEKAREYAGAAKRKVSGLMKGSSQKQSTSQYKAGDTQVVGGVKYVRDESGKWHSK